MNQDPRTRAALRRYLRAVNKPPQVFAPPGASWWNRARRWWRAFTFGRI